MSTNQATGIITTFKEYRLVFRVGIAVEQSRMSLISLVTPGFTPYRVVISQSTLRTCN